jgi:hypothetical protein
VTETVSGENDRLTFSVFDLPTTLTAARVDAQILKLLHVHVDVLLMESVAVKMVVRGRWNLD